MYLSLIHISEPTRPLYISYAVFCLKKKKKKKKKKNIRQAGAPPKLKHLTPRTPRHYQRFPQQQRMNKQKNIVNIESPWTLEQQTQELEVISVYTQIRRK
eukprot:TRINITY_DN3684_c0_g1_i2.p3 TRINITY_DN3684_c0_g1~~TRINITY_DN3684_c0_g1_i2.p3  ORF type:complete len:100 (-),score=13.35 TRINITY_DN3684_c0_g1_i2:29-328(-)